MGEGSNTHKGMIPIIYGPTIFKLSIFKPLERCYREDSFSSYELSSLPSGKIEERGLTLDNKGIGRLVDGNIDQYMKFKGQNLIVTMNWDSPANISGKNTVSGSLI